MERRLALRSKNCFYSHARLSMPLSGARPYMSHRIANGPLRCRRSGSNSAPRFFGTHIRIAPSDQLNDDEGQQRHSTLERMRLFCAVDKERNRAYIACGFGEGRQLSEADLTSRGACESLSLDLPRLTTRPPTRS